MRSWRGAIELAAAFLPTVLMKRLGMLQSPESLTTTIITYVSREGIWTPD
jgi:hypothetical protein